MTDKHSGRVAVSGRGLLNRLNGIFVRSRSGPTLIAALFLLLAVFYRITDPPLLEQFRLRNFDSYVRKWPHEAIDKQPITILDIDERSLDALGQWPWPRTVVGALLKSLVSYDVRVLTMDVVFSEEDRTSPKNLVRHVLYDIDPLTRDRLARLPDNELAMTKQMKDLPVVLGMPNMQRNEGATLPLVPESSVKGKFGPDPLPFIRTNYFQHLLPNINILNLSARGFGVFSFGFDSDGTVRRVPIIVRVGDTIYPGLALEALRVGSGSDALFVRSESNLGITSVILQSPNASRAVATDGEGRLWIKFALPQPYNIAYHQGQTKRLYVSAIDVLEKRIPKEWLQDNYVFLGSSASGLKDLRNTPVDPSMPGVEVHANVLSNILSGDSLTTPSYIDVIETLLLILTGVVMIVITRRLSLLPAITLTIAIIVCNVSASIYIYLRHGVLYDAIFNSLVILGIFLMFTLFNYLRESREKKHIRRAFVQYLSPDLVAQLAEAPEKLSLGGELRVMSFLFCDVRGFTSISESYKSNPQGLTHLINRLLTPLTNEILQRKGTIDKYMGDCIMAFWNAPLLDEEHAKNAVDSGLRMFQALASLNDEREKEAEEEGLDYQPLRIGIGINTGEAVVGNMGSEQRFDYSVLGDPVNLASRLEGQSKSYGVDIVIGENTARSLDEDYVIIELDMIAVKGKSEAVKIYAVLGDASYDQRDTVRDLLPAHEEFLKLYRRQQWNQARQHIARAMSFAPLTHLYKMYEERIEAYLLDPPAAEWDGVFRAMTK